MGRQPWIVQGLLKTADANSPSVSTTWLAISLTVFVLLYVLLLVVDVWLMRRYRGARPGGCVRRHRWHAPPAPAA